MIKPDCTGRSIHNSLVEHLLNGFSSRAADEPDSFGSVWADSVPEPVKAFNQAEEKRLERIIGCLFS